MESNLDDKQLLVLGYLRRLLNTANILDDDDEKSLNDTDLPPIEAPLSKFEETMQLFNLGIPQLKMRSSSIDSVASDLSDNPIRLHTDFTLPTDVIQSVYHYYNRFQRYLFLLGGSEECKDNSYNAVQIINLRNISDIKQKLEYPYTNYRLNLHLWHAKIDYDSYFYKPKTSASLRSSMISIAPIIPESMIPDAISAQSILSVVQEGKAYPKPSRKPATPKPISIMAIEDVSDDEKEEIKRDSKTIIKVDSPSSPWTSQNSPYFDSSALIPFNALRNKPRSKSVSKLSKLPKKEAPKRALPKIKSKSVKQLPKVKAKSMKKIKNPFNKRSSAKFVKKKQKNTRKKNTNMLPRSASVRNVKSTKTFKTKSVKTFKSTKSTRTLQSDSKKKRKKKNKLQEKPGKMVRRHSAAVLGIVKNRKKGKKQELNVIMGTKDFDRYSYGQCIMPISNEIHGAIPSWPWFKMKYKSDIKRQKDNLEFCKFKLFIRCAGIYTKDDEYTNENDLLLFNAASLNDIGREIDCYFCKLPGFKQKIESPGIVYNGMDNLLAFGGYSYDDGKASKTIYSLNLNTKRAKLKWKKYGCLMNKPRYDVSVTQIINNKGRNKFIIMGGKGKATKPIDIVEIFDSSKSTKESKCSECATLNFKRFKAGSCQLNGNNRSKIAVAGGIMYGKGVHRVEIYDMNKDVWMVHDAELQYDHQHPSIWCEVNEINPNILYIAGNNISFGAKKGSLGFIEWTDLRMKKKQFNLLYDEPLEEIFEFWNLRPNIWEPRSLIQFQM